MWRAPRRGSWALLLFIIVVCGVLAIVHKRLDHGGHADPVIGMVRRVFLDPPSRAMERMRAWGDDSVLALFRGPRIARENRRLKSQIAALSQQNRDLQAQAQENVRLRQMLALRARSPLTLLAAQVIALKPSSFRDTLTLDRGASSGVTQRMPVLDSAGNLVGQVIDVTPDSSDVLLLTDDLSSVGSLVVPQRRAATGPTVSGISQGERAPLLNLVDLPQDADVRVGDEIVTSGLGAIYPKNIPVGAVTSVGIDQATAQRSAAVTPNADLDHLQDVFILTGKP
jgi:rod shape-determining protein MreC